jgi:hypothetical protein
MARSRPAASRAPHTAVSELSYDCQRRVCGALSSRMANRYTGSLMANPIQPNVKLTNTPAYRENYANSVQIRVNVWDFFLVFGTLLQQTETQVEIQNFQGIYLSPQQAKALLGVLQQNVTGYENAFGEIKLDPRMMPQGPVH